MSQLRQVRSHEEPVVVRNIEVGNLSLNKHTHETPEIKITQIRLRNPGYYGNYSTDISAFPVVDRGREHNTQYAQAPILE
jgi:hypothetical protein